METKTNIIELSKDEYYVYSTDEQLVYGSDMGGKEPAPPIEEDDTLASKQTLRVLVAVSEGEISEVTDVYVGGTNISNYKNIRYDVRYGTNNQSYVEGFSNVETPHPVNAAVELFYGIKITKSVSSINVDAVRITLTFAALLKTDDKGNTRGNTAVHTIYTRPVGGVWEIADTFKVTGKASGPTAFDVRIQRPALAEGITWEIQVERTSPDEASIKEKSKASWTSTTEIQEVTETYPDTAIIAITAKNAKRLGGSFPELMARVKGLKVLVPGSTYYNHLTKTYTNVPWDGSFDPIARWSSNPAWQLYHLLKHTRYGSGIPDSDINKFAFFDLAKICDQKVDILDENDNVIGQECRYEFHNQFLEREDERAFLDYFLTITNSHFSEDAFKNLSIVTDVLTPTTKFETNSSVENGIFDYSSSDIEERYTRVNVVYNNVEDFGNTDTITWPDESPTQFELDLISKYGDNAIDIPLVGCLSRGQALRKAKHIFYTSCIQTQFIGFKKFLAGVLYTVGEVIEVIDDANQLVKQQGLVSNHTIVSSSEITVTLDRLFTDLTGITHIAYYTETGFNKYTIGSFYENADHKTEVNLTSLVANDLIPITNTPYILYGDISPTKWKVISISVESNMYSINAMQYDENKYAYVDSGVYLKPSVFINRKNITTPPVKNVDVNEIFYNDAVRHYASLYVSWDGQNNQLAQAGEPYWDNVTSLLSYNSEPFVDSVGTAVGKVGQISLDSTIKKFGAGSYSKKPDYTRDFWENVVLCIDFDDVIEDEKGKQITNTNVVISSNRAKFGYKSGYFNGSSYLTIPTHRDFNFAEGNFTLSCYVNFTAIPSGGNFATILSKRDSATSNNSFILQYDGNGSFKFSVSYNGTSIAQTAVFNLTAVVNNWYHIAVVRDLDNIDIYINGTKGTTANVGTNEIFLSSASLKIGAADTGNINLFQGYMSNLEITFGHAQFLADFSIDSIIAAKYSYLTKNLPAIGNNNYTAETYLYLPKPTEDIYADSTELYVNMFGESRARRYWGIRIEENNNGITALPFTWNIYGAMFPESPAANFYLAETLLTGSSHMSGNGQAKFNVTEANFPFNITGVAEVEIALTAAGADITSPSGTAIASPGAGAIQVNNVGGGSAASAFNNNTNDAFNQGNQVIFQPNNLPSFIGYDCVVPVWPAEIRFRNINGTIWATQGGYDDATKTKLMFPKIVSIIASDDGITWDTIATQTLVNNNTAFAWVTLPVPPQQQAQFRDSTGKALTLYGTPYIQNIVKPEGPSAGYFNGTTDYIDTETSSRFTCGLEDFTLEAWINPVAYSTNISGSIIIDSRPLDVNGAYLTLILGSAGELIFSTNSANQITSEIGSIPLNTWSHVSVCRRRKNGLDASSGNMHTNLYVNGRRVGSTYTDSNNYLQNYFRIASYNTTSVQNTRLFSGYMSKVRFSRGIARYASNFTLFDNFYNIASSYDVDFDKNIFLLDCDNTNGSVVFYDSMHKSVTAANVTHSTAEKRHGITSALFSGTASSLSFANHTDFNLDSSDFTLEMAVRFTSGMGNAVTLYSDESPPEYGSILFKTVNDKISFSYMPSNAVSKTNSANLITLTGITSLAPNTWYHIKVVRENTTLTLFLDENVEISSAINVGIYATSGTKYIGRRAAGSEYFTGYMDSLRFTKNLARIYSTNQASAMWHQAATTTDPYYDKVTFLCGFNGFINGTNFVDIKRNTITVNGNAQTRQYTRRTGQSSGYFDGSGDYLSIPNTSNFQFGTGDYTVEIYVYITAYSTGGDINDMSLFSVWNGSSGYMFYIKNTTGKMGYWNGTYGRETSGGIPLNTWNLLTYSRVNGTLYLFLNGKLETSITDTYNYDNNGSYKIGGGFLTSSDRMFNGYMDEMRVTKGVGRYSNSYTPSHTPFSRKKAQDFTLISNKLSEVDPSGFSLSYNAASGSIQYSIGNTISELLSTGSLKLAYQTFYHVAVARSNGVVKGFVDGIIQFSSFDNSNLSNALFKIGSNLYNKPSCFANLDETRITNGVARYLDNFIPPTASYLTSQEIIASGDSSYSPTYSVFYRRNDDNYTVIEDLTRPFYEIEYALPGLYEIVIYAQNLYLLKSDPVTTVYNYKTGAIGSSTLLPPIDFYVEGTTNNLFETKDCYVSWSANPGNSTARDRLMDYIVEVWTGDGITKKNTFYVKPQDLYGESNLIDDGLFIYSFDQNRLDFHTPTREFQLKVYARDVGGNLSSPAVSNFVNNPPATASGTVVFGTEVVYINILPLSETDLAGYVCHMSTVNGFTPGEANVVYIGDSPSITLPIDGSIKYIKFAGFDMFGRVGLNYSSQYTGNSLGTIITWNFLGLTFKANDPVVNTVSWTAGTAYNSAGESYSIAQGSAAWTSGIMYIYYTSGSNVLTTTTNLPTAIANGTRILATYEGGTLLVVGNGDAFISGDKLLAGTVGSNALVTNTAVITNTAQIATAIITNELIVPGTLKVDRIISGSLEKITTVNKAFTTVPRNVVTDLLTGGFYSYTCNNSATSVIVLSLSVSFDCPPTTNYVSYTITNSSSGVLSFGDFYNRTGNTLDSRYFYTERAVVITVPADKILRIAIAVNFHSSDAATERDYSDIVVHLKERYS